MQIGVHAKALSEQNPTGVGLYTRYLLRHLVSLPEAASHRFLLYVNSARVLSRRKVGIPTSLNREFEASGKIENCKLKIMHAPALWTQGRLACELFLRKPDIFFTSQHVLPKTAPKNSVVTIHGLEFERFPQYYSLQERMYLSWVTKDAVKRASRIIAVSCATKRDLMELYHAPEEKITVIWHGISSRHSREGGNPDPSPALPLVRGGRGWGSAPYFLYIGRIEKKKNVDGIIRAFVIAKEQYKLPHKLVLAGGDGYGSENIKYQISNVQCRDQIELLGYISEDKKWQLLHGAEAFVFPSWYEGFGLPILEAQQAGVPVITSNISAMPEIAGSPSEVSTKEGEPLSGIQARDQYHTLVYDTGHGALFVDPADPEAIADAMYRVTEDKVLRDALVAKGYENVKRFSWEKCARETLEVLTQRLWGEYYSIMKKRNDEVA